MSALATFIGRSGVPGVGELLVRETRSTLGRDRSCDLVLPGMAVSPVHAELHLRGGVWWLNDLSSDEGSWIDGERVLGSAPLAAGSVLRLGQASLVFAPRDSWEDSPEQRPELPESRMSVTWPPRDEPMAPAFHWPGSHSAGDWYVYVGGLVVLSIAVYLVAHFLSRNG